MRIVTDFLRVDKTFLGLTGSQWTSAAVVLVCLTTLVWFALHPERGAAAETPADRVEPTGA